MKPSLVVKNAFLNRRIWMPYFNLLHGLFSEDKIEIIHHAKSIAVGIACIRLQETYGFSPVNIYTLVKGMYCFPAYLRLSSELMDLSSYESFVDSLATIQARVNSLRHRCKVMSEQV